MVTEAVGKESTVKLSGDYWKPVQPVLVRVNTSRLSTVLAAEGIQ